MIGRLFLAAAFLLVGFGQLIWSVTSLREALDARSWPIAIAHIDASKVETSTNGGRTAIYPSVTYTYEVKGQTLMSHGIYLTDFATTESDATRIVTMFPPNASTRVYYDPDNPARAVLLPGLSWYSYVWVGLACLAIGVGAVAIGLPAISRRRAGAA